MSEIVQSVYGLVYIIVAASIISYSVVGVNWAYRISEASAVGLTVGLGLLTSLQTIYNLGYLRVIRGEYLILLWMIIGALGALRIFPKYLMFSRPAAALVWGTTAGVLLATDPYNQLINFSRWAKQSFLVPDTWVLYIGLIACFSFFAWTKKFSIHDRGKMGILPKLGRWMLLFMLADGTTSLIFKRITFAVSMLGEIRVFLKAWGIPV